MLTQIAPTEIVSGQRRFFQTGATKPIEFRLEQLQKLKQVLLDNQDAIASVLREDLGKPTFEAVAAEIFFCIEEINYTLKHLNAWIKPQKVSVPLTQWPASARIVPEPLGVTLIIGAWNYPVQLVFAPLIGAIAAGNCTILKPSELAVNTSKLVARLIAQNFNPEFIAAIEGGKEITQALLSEKFDHIFFTGGTKVGKIIMEAAAKNLSSVTLELGGKSPCIVENDAPVDLTAKKIAWGKFINSGQTCVAPDYLLVRPEIKAELVQKIEQYVQEFYSSDPLKSESYARIVNDFHFQRLSNLLNSGNILTGGQTNAEERYIAPTLVDGVSWEDEVMEDEIFGPILPILEYNAIEEAIAQINARPKPLALYLFSNTQATQERVLAETSSGGVCINDTMVQCVCPELPFGGVGSSGIGAYHGKRSFDAFSHQKSVLKRSFFFDLKIKYPPYEGKLNLMKFLLK